MRTTLIIGASSGIGKILSNTLHKKGEKTIAFSRSAPEAVYSDYYKHDILSSAELPKLEESIDGLVYCPGSINLKPFRTFKQQDFENDFKLNVLGAIKSIQAYTQNLLSSKQASIVLFSTVAVQTGMPFHSSVSISKGAIEGLTKALAAEFSPKIRVNCVAPSLTSTAMANKLINTPEKLEASNNRHPLKRIGNPEDIANTVEFLLSPHSSWITGQIIHVDGGMSSLKI
jgi:NAD(P)-dependent dehydrogenase (short-subunit alcohol dehydrogenase family)